MQSRNLSQRLKAESSYLQNIDIFDDKNFYALCDLLCGSDRQLENILLQYGYPPLWSRQPGFATLIHIILEQQVSLASAKAAFDKLHAFTGNVSPGNIAALSDAELKACYFSRQKIRYARHLAEAVLNKELNLEQLEHQPDAVVNLQLKKIKGIGDWTVDVYLMMALHRTDCFPLGDIALVRSFKEVKGLPDAGKEDILNYSQAWKPYRTIAAFLLWHAYLAKRKKQYY